MGTVLNWIGSVSRSPFSSERLLPHLNQRRHSHRKPSHRISSFVLHFKVLYQMYLPCCCLLAEKIAVHLHSTIFSPAVCFPTTSCIAVSIHAGGVGGLQPSHYSCLRLLNTSFNSCSEVFRGFNGDIGTLPACGDVPFALCLSFVLSIWDELLWPTCGWGQLGANPWAVSVEDFWILSLK